MKNKIFKIFIIFFFSIFIFQGFTKKAYGCSNPPICYHGDISYCRNPECTDCSWCQTPPTRAPGPSDPTESITGKITNPILSDRLKTMPGDVFLNNFLRTGINFVLLIGSVIFFFVLTSGGVKWLSSSGDKAKLESAQKQISSGLVGLAILLSTFVIMKLIETLFGISLLQFTLPTL